MRSPIDRATRLARLRAAFLDEARAEHQELAALLADDLLDPGAEAGRERARKLAHDLHGAGGSYGFPAISAAARALEDALGAGPLAPFEPDLVRAGVVALGRALDEAAG